MLFNHFYLIPDGVGRPNVLLKQLIYTCSYHTVHHIQWKFEEIKITNDYYKLRIILYT